jgi:F0F1-type ATP synthase assembly protein I
LKEKERAKYARRVLVIMGLLIEFSFTILGAFILGHYIDTWRGTEGFYTVIFLILGGIVSVKIFYMLYSRAKKIMEDK